jgi:hypothetical protein
MTPLHLVADSVHDIVKRKSALLAPEVRMKHYLKQQIAQFVAQVSEVVALDSIGYFVRLLDRIRRNRAEILLEIPRAATLRITQPGHEFEESVDGHQVCRMVSRFAGSIGPFLTFVTLQLIFNGSGSAADTAR